MNLIESIIEISSKKEIEDSKGCFVLYFYGDNCGGCDLLKKVIEQAVQDDDFKRHNIVFLKANIANPEFRDIMLSRNIMSIPYMIFYNGNEEIFSYIGFITFWNFKNLFLKLYEKK